MMLRIRKLTDYATVILAHLARHADKSHTTSAISKVTHIAQPTVRKLLKQLTRAQLLTAYRGRLGGYRLTLPPQDISLATVIRSIEGVIAITECSQTNHHCAVVQHCSIQQQWRLINQQIQTTLNNISLAQMIQPNPIAAMTPKVP